MDEILWTWKFVELLLTLLVGKITSVPSNEVKLVCVSCKNGGSLLIGNAGEDLVLRYDILNRNFTLFEVDYNDNKIEMSKEYISTKYVKDKRLVVPKKVTKKGDTTSIQLTLKRLSLEVDNLVPFKYTYRNVDLDIFQDETVVQVLAPPTFCKPPKKTYKINSGVKVPIEFSLCGNPKATVAATLGSKIIPVKYLNSTSKYSFNYGIELLLSKEQCGEILKLEAKSFQNASAGSEIKVLFQPDPVKNVTAVRDNNNVLTVYWQGIQQVGSCAPQYHVKRTVNSVIEKWGTRDTSYIFHGAEGNNTISVNAEINGREGEYSEPIFIAAEIPKNETGHSKQVQGDGIGVGGIVGIVIALLVILALVLFILWSRKRNEKNDAHNSNFGVTKDTDPLSEPHENNETDNKVQPGDELIYAELGPGGRQGDKKPSPQSNYSKPKTEGMYYPEPKKPVVGSSKPSWSSVSIQPEDDSFDYQSSIVI